VVVWTSLRKVQPHWRPACPADSLSPECGPISTPCLVQYGTVVMFYIPTTAGGAPMSPSTREIAVELLTT
jgi:hypothetical protein